MTIAKKLFSILLLITIATSCSPTTITVREINLSETELVLQPGQTETITAEVLPEDATDKTVTWKSESESISVENGTITVSAEAVPGTYTITATSSSNPEVSAICTITVQAAAAGGGGGGGGPVVPATPDVVFDVSSLPDGSISDQTLVSDPITVEESDSVIKLTGLESGKLYSLYTEQAQAIRARSSAKISEGNKNRYTFVLPEGETEIEFNASDIGLGNGGSFRIGEVYAPHINFEDGNEAMTISESDEPIFTDENGRKVYEKYFSIDISGIEDRSNIALITTSTGSGSGGHNYGFVSETGEAIREKEIGSVFDLSEFDTVYIYLYMEVTESLDSISVSLHLVNPITIGTEAVDIKAPSIYRIEPSAENRYMVFELEGGPDQNIYLGATGLNEDLNARNLETGKRHPRFFPVKMDGNKVIFNLEANANPIIFNIESIGDSYTVKAHIDEEMEEINLRKIEVEADKDLDTTLIIPAGEAIVPAIFTSDDPGALAGFKNAVVEFSGGTFRILFSHDSEVGFSSYSPDPGKIFSLYEEDKLEYCLLYRSRELPDTTVNLRLSRQDQQGF
ncbi:MAG: Ig-like domain-containing protein [Spirochaetes bacterium]|uniref:Ig-like domain-containing protein n=1 Tax=Candidatus Ornithospirochaeta stercoripullorum TaxID=2840899 RepID=A0A9D9DXX3_9SPIO|nr:Ig-like domain-containing protein [Candidatus Ornithospirochaeta stercoripullorum]